MGNCLYFGWRIYGLSIKVLQKGRRYLDFEVEASSLNTHGFKNVIA